MFGKILVFLHVCLSIILMVFALLLFYNRIDWTDKAPKGTEPEGLFLTRKKEFEAASRGGFWPADERFRQSRVVLETHEAARPVERPFYALQIEFLKTGATEDNPVRQVDREGGHPIPIENAPPGGDQVQMGQVKDDKGNVTNGRDGKPLVLKSFDYYNKEIGATMAQENAALKRRHLASLRDIEATNKLKGPKGLHARLIFEVAKQELIKDEYNEVRPLWLNTMVELQNLEDLRGRLKDRLDELEKLKSKGDKLGR